MLAAAPESRCGAATVEGETGKTSSPAEPLPFAPLRVHGTGEAPVATWASVATGAPVEAGRANASAAQWASVALGERDCCGSMPRATYSVAEVSSSEAAKLEPMGLIFSAESAIH